MNKIVTKIALLLIYIVIFGYPLVGNCSERNVLKIDNEFLRKYLPDVKNPRLMTDEDIKEKY